MRAVDNQTLADESIRQVLLTQYDGVPAVRLDSPPGAGKTEIVERLAVQGMALHDERCMVVTQTNQQAFDFARRCAQGFPDLPITLLVRERLVVPDDLAGIPNLQIVRNSRWLPSGPCIVVANARRWSWSEAGAVEGFNCQFVDEAFQLSDYHFHEIASLTERFVLVGDPGQIHPVITADVERWRSDLAGPHVPCPQALVARYPGEVLRMNLPVSRRLVPDSVEFVQPAFYPDLSFQALSAPGLRRLFTTVAGRLPLDAPVDMAERGASLIYVELPARVTGEADIPLAEAMVGLIDRLLQRGAVVIEGGREQVLRPDMIGVVCTHVSQVHAVQERLPTHMKGVLVETADRYQGLERSIMLVHHLLSGRTDAEQFHLDAGRLCVMISRHRLTCFLFGRAGIGELLSQHPPSGERILGLEEDAEYEGWRAHMDILRKLQDRGRVVQLSL